MFDPYLLHKYKFKTPCRKYYLKYTYYVCILVIDYIISYFILKQIIVTGFIGLIVKGIIVVLISVILFIVANYRTHEYKEIKVILNNVIINKLKRGVRVK